MMRQSFRARYREWSTFLPTAFACNHGQIRLCKMPQHYTHRVLQNSLPGNSGKVSELLTVRGETVSLFELTTRNS